jgi:hypothetical protein
MRLYHMSRRRGNLPILLANGRDIFLAKEGKTMNFLLKGLVVTGQVWTQLALVHQRA